MPVWFARDQANREPQVRVLLIDDHEIIWSGTQRLLERLSQEVSPHTAFSFVAARALQDALAHPPASVDLVLLDYHLPDGSGRQALAMVQSHFEGVPVCLLSAERDPGSVRALVEAGAAGFIPKSYSLQDMEAALRLVLRHRVYLPAEFVLAEDAARIEEPDEVPPDDLCRFLQTELSTRQREVLALAVRGLPSKLIARQLEIAEGTVKAHLSMVYRARGVRNRTDALCRVFQAGAADALGLG